MVIPAYAGMYCINSLDSSFRWNDEGVSFRLYIILACLPQTGSCYFLHTQSTCGLTHSELKRASKIKASGILATVSLVSLISPAMLVI